MKKKPETKTSIRVTDKNIKICKTLKSNIDIALESVKKDWDCIGLVTGMEGSGKSTLAASLLYYMGYNPKTKTSNFSEKWIAFSPDHFEYLCKIAKQDQAILFDEFVLAGLSTDAMTKMQKTITKLFTLFRYKRLKVLLVIPNIWMLGGYFAVARTRFLVHAYSPDGVKRGYYRFYNRRQKRFLYLRNKRYWEYKGVPPSFKGKHYVKSVEEVGLNPQKYKDLKEEAVLKLTDDSKDDKWKLRWYNLLVYVKEKVPGISIKDISEECDMGMNYNSIRNSISQCKKIMQDKEIEREKTRELKIISKANKGKTEFVLDKMFNRG